MAMTTCPNCGEQISDKAKKCVHCGAILVPEEKKYCPDCGAELEEGMDTCPKCGCPIENIIETEKTPQQVEVTGVKITKKSKKIIVIATIAVIVAAIITECRSKGGGRGTEAERGIRYKSEYGSIFYAFWCQ